MPNGNENREIRAVLWVFWVGLLVSTGGECLLFAMMEPTGASPVVTAASVLGGLGVTMFGVASYVGHTRLAGGGVPTALIVWLLLKAVSLMGLVAYQLTAQHWLFWPFLATFIASMAWWHPAKFSKAPS